MRVRKNLASIAFQLEAEGKFGEALDVWKRESTFLIYPGAYVRAAEIARIQGKSKLLSNLLSRIHPLSVFQEFGNQLGENLVLEWIGHQGPFNITSEVTPKILAALWEVGGEIPENKMANYSVALMQDLPNLGKSTIQISRPEVENNSLLRILSKKNYKRIKFESICIELIDAIATVGSSSFIVDDACLVDEFRIDYPQVATRIDDPLVLGIRNREVLTPKFVRKELKTIEKAFWLGLKYSSEHGHFVTTVLTRLSYFERHPEWGHAPVVIGSKLTMTHRGILQLLYPDVEFQEFEEGSSIHFKNLFVAPTSVFSPTTLSSISRPPKWVFVDTTEFDLLYAKLGSAPVPNFNLPKKIAIARNGYSRRKLINAYQWEALALENGYSLIDPADLSAEEEIYLFKNATHIIGESGSWVYLTGLNPNNQVIILTHDKDFIFWNEFSQLNSLRNSKFKIIRGRRLIHWRIKVNLSNLHAEWKLTSTSRKKVASLI